MAVAGQVERGPGMVDGVPRQRRQETVLRGAEVLHLVHHHRAVAPKQERLVLIRAGGRQGLRQRIQRRHLWPMLPAAEARQLRVPLREDRPEARPHLRAEEPIGARTLDLLVRRLRPDVILQNHIHPLARDEGPVTVMHMLPPRGKERLQGIPHRGRQPIRVALLPARERRLERAATRPCLGQERIEGHHIHARKLLLRAQLAQHRQRILRERLGVRGEEDTLVLKPLLPQQPLHAMEGHHRLARPRRPRDKHRPIRLDLHGVRLRRVQKDLPILQLAVQEGISVLVRQHEIMLAQARVVAQHLLHGRTLPLRLHLLGRLIIGFRPGGHLKQQQPGPHVQVPVVFQFRIRHPTHQGDLLLRYSQLQQLLV